jgi:hypothetical protein
MPRGNKILVSDNPKGNFGEGVINTGETPYPGTIMQRDPTQSLVGGRPVYKMYNRDADGNRPAGAFWVLLEDDLQGKLSMDAYAAGERCRLYSPLPGDEVNLRFGNASGTGDDVTAGDLMIVDDGTGEVITTTGSPETEVAMALEAITDPTEDQLLWCEWTGH